MNHYECHMLSFQPSKKSTTRKFGHCTSALCQPVKVIPRTRKWLGSPPFASHKMTIWKGNNPILRGLTATMVMNHVSKSVFWVQHPPPSRLETDFMYQKRCGSWRKHMKGVIPLMFFQANIQHLPRNAEEFFKHRPFFPTLTAHPWKDAKPQMEKYPFFLGCDIFFLRDCSASNLIYNSCWSFQIMDVFTVTSFPRLKSAPLFTTTTLPSWNPATSRVSSRPGVSPRNAKAPRRWNVKKKPSKNHPIPHGEKTELEQGVITSGQIIATSHDLTPNGGLVREIPLFQGNLGWWNIII